MKFKLVLFILTLQYFSICQSTLIPLSDDLKVHEELNDGYFFTPKLAEIKSKLANAPRSEDKDAGWIKMKIPFADGVYHEVEVAEAPVVAEKIYNRYPENRSYKVRSIKDKYVSGRMAITANGMTAMLYTKAGHLFIEPTDSGSHRSYNFEGSIMESFSCRTDHSNIKGHTKSGVRTSIGSNQRKYIIAIASSAEFSAKHGNNLSNINAAITDYLTLLNTLYERDLAVTFELTADNDDIIFFDASGDGIESNNKLGSAQTVISNGIGSANYDIGHVFYEIPFSGNGWTGSGIASLGVVCSASTKARGWSGCGGNYPNSFWMGIFAHEVGHQFDATHTFYGTAGNCGGSQRSVGNGVEPGSGNSLMSYEGSCGAGGSCSNQNISPQANFQYFHSHSIDQIQSFVSSSGSCFASSSSSNSPPVITMPSNKTIPTETPFVLSASVTDADGDPLLYSWEQVDTDNLNLSCPNGSPNAAATSTTAPLFRSFDPSAEGATRYFPQLSDIIDDTQTMGEILPEVGRTIEMRFSARGTDPNGISGISYEDVTITVDGNSGPFEVLTASSPTGYVASASVNVQWTVGNTNQSPISCSNVNILFSNDGGESFPITLASNTANDGSQTVTMPANGTNEGRIKIEAVGNIFFSVNKADISILSDCEPNSSDIINDDDVTADVGDPSLDLGLVVGAEVNSVSGTIDGSDPSTNLIGENSSTGNCIAFTNMPKYETVLLLATATDVYSFNMSATFTDVVNIYDNVFNPPATSCQNWLASSLTYNPFSITNSTSVALNQGDVIEMVISGFDSSSSGSYSVSISSNGAGALIDANFIPTGFVYRYVIYNSSGTIIAIEDEADLTDGGTFTSDVYTVRGLMVFEAENLSSYINQSFASLQNDVVSGAVCGELSSNDVTVTINGCTAGTKTVTSSLDNGGAGTLRNIIDNACPGDAIQFSAGLNNSTLVLNSEILIDENLIINGLGMNNLTISGNNSSRIFSIVSGVNVEISDVSLINGFASSDGGALLNNGNLQLENIRFDGNKNGLISKAFTNLGTVQMSSEVTILD